MLKPIDDLAKAGKYKFVDATVFVRAQEEAGFSLTSLWGYEFKPYFQDVDK